MTLTVDLNSDMGEGFGPWKMTDDAGLLNIVTSANIACGFHAGDADTMAMTMGLAAKADVGIGAHPGFPDLQGFGRRQMQVPLLTLANMVRYQVSAAMGMARAAGSRWYPRSAPACSMRAIHRSPADSPRIIASATAAFSSTTGLG